MRDFEVPVGKEAIDVARNDAKLPSAEESFREAWRDALRGETMPISELWEGIEGTEEA